MANRDNRKDNRGRKLKNGERQRPDGRYEYRYNDPASGKRIAIYDMDLAELRQKEREIDRDIDNGLMTAGELRNATVNMMFEKHMGILQVEDTTRSNYQRLWERNVKDSLGLMKVIDVRATHIKMLYSELTKQGYAWGTLKIIHGIICPIFDMAVDDCIIVRNPAAHQLNGFGEKPKAREALTADQQETLLSFVEGSACYRKHLPLLQIMIGTACRVGELTGLTWADVDHNARELNIDHQLIYKNFGDGCKFHVSDPKTEAGVRIIPMTDTVCHAFTEQKKNQFMLGINRDIEVDGLKNFVFTSKNGMPLAPNAVNNVLYNIVDKYNKQETEKAKKERRRAELLPKVSAHIMRHTGCTRMAESGMDPKVLQYIMGHADFSVTMNVYNHISDLGRVKREMERVESSKYSVVG